MTQGDWNNQLGDGLWWLPMVIMMVVFIGGLVWLGVVLIRRGGHMFHPGWPHFPTATRQTPSEILAERPARGEIDIDDYRQRLDALRPVDDSTTIGR